MANNGLFEVGNLLHLVRADVKHGFDILVLANNREPMRKIWSYLKPTIFIIALIAIYNIWNYAINGSPTLAKLTDEYWVGYYGNEELEELWFISKFYKADGVTTMIALSDVSLSFVFGKSDNKHVDKFHVEINSRDREHATLTFSLEGIGPVFRANQLYYGKKYFFGPLLNGDFNKVLRKNLDKSIRGVSIDKMNGDYVNFELGQDMLANELLDFANSLVSKDSQFTSMDELNDYFEMNRR
ncbi:hypothetical protein [Marinoscillum luteum]|uniref:DUF4105 domain-containing protein n=1 Tax=Marinoscillum luteum TaxID=861051 RepID=A0ABW7N2C7_9BACT